jgi:hypothetical protein
LRTTNAIRDRTTVVLEPNNASTPSIEVGRASVDVVDTVEPSVLVLVLDVVESVVITVVVVDVPSVLVLVLDAVESVVAVVVVDVPILPLMESNESIVIAFI